MAEDFPWQRKALYVGVTMFTVILDAQLTRGERICDKRNDGYVMVSYFLPLGEKYLYWPLGLKLRKT